MAISFWESDVSVSENSSAALHEFSEFKILFEILDLEKNSGPERLPIWFETVRVQEVVGQIRP